MLVLLFLCAIHGSHGGESEEQTCLPDYDDVLFFLISPLTLYASIHVYK